MDQSSNKPNGGTKGWEPPSNFVPELDKILHHNKREPERQIGAIKTAQWLGRNQIEVSKDAVYRWMKKRSKILDANS